MHSLGNAYNIQIHILKINYQLTGMYKGVIQ